MTTDAKTHISNLDITTLAERPDQMPLTSQLEDPAVAPFLYQDSISEALFRSLVFRHPEYTLLAVERDTGRPAAMLCTMPFTADDQPPSGGYDAVLLSAAANTLTNRTGKTVSALFATVRPDLRGRGLSTTMVIAALHNTARIGHDALLAPVRPTHKHQHPEVPMAEYVTRRRPDGTAADPWIRVHERVGGRLIAIAPHSMTITATLHQWRQWTGLPFDTAGPVLVPGAMVPVLCDPERDIATYVEPNVWFRHDLAGRF